MRRYHSQVIARPPMTESTSSDGLDLSSSSESPSTEHTLRTHSTSITRPMPPTLPISMYLSSEPSSAGDVSYLLVATRSSELVSASKPDLKYQPLLFKHSHSERRQSAPASSPRRPAKI